MPIITRVAAGNDNSVGRTAPATQSRAMPSWLSPERRILCADVTRDAPAAVPKVGQCPSGWMQSGNYCIAPQRGADISESGYGRYGTSKKHRPMSAFGGKADMTFCTAYVCF